jgi:hypothetical protein
MERLVAQNNAWGILEIQVWAGIIGITVNGLPVYGCSERFIAEQFKDKENDNAHR